MNEQPFRDLLKARLDASNPGATVDTLRIERTFYAVRNRQTGAVRFVVQAVQPGANNCNTIVGEINFDPAEEELILVGHTHPYTLNETVTFCNSKPDGRRFTPGYSTPDWDTLLELAVALLKAGLPLEDAMAVDGYTIDKNFATKYELVPENLDSLKQMIWPHSSSSCPWF